MKYLNINLNKVSPSESTLIVDCLNQGGIIIYPTDTIYGFGCRADQPEAISRLRQIKKLEADKPLLVLLKNLQQVKKYCHFNLRQALLIRKNRLAARPTSFILSHKHNLPEILTGGSDGLGFRLPKSRFLRKILRALDCPLVSTSLNLSGHQVLLSPDNLPTEFKVDLVINAGLLKNRASKIIDLKKNKLKIIRQ